MTHPAIRFETYEVAAAPNPARMDVTAFVGYVSPRAGAVLPASLAQTLGQTYGDDGSAILNRPVPVGSLAMFDAVFDADDRLAAVAEIVGGPLAATLPGSGVDPVLTVVVDGVLHDIDLLPLPRTPAEALARVAAGLGGLPVQVELVAVGTAEALRLRLHEAHGVGTLAILPYPTLGFPNTRRAEAQALPSPMALAVRQYFAGGGTKAVVVALGRPPAYDTPRETRMAALQHLVLGGPRAKTASFATVTAAYDRANAVSPLEPAAWHGIQHMLGTEEVTFLCLPDLSELVAPRPVPLPDLPTVPLPAAVFAECLHPGGTAGPDQSPRYPAPQMDEIAGVLWVQSLSRLLGTIRLEMRDKLLLAALPRPRPGVALPALPDSAFCQIAEGWVRARISAAAPEGLMAPDAALAAHLALTARTRGTFVSAANQPLLALSDVEPRAASGLATCRFYSDLRGILLSADLTPATDPAWADAPVSRLMALLLRECRALGDALTFEPSSPKLWSDIRAALVGLLHAVYRAGALAGRGEGTSYDVTCDRTTMSQDDIDNGRLIAELSFLPARPVARITVRLPLTEGGPRA